MIHLRKLLIATGKRIVELRIEISNEGRPSASSDNLSVETNRIGAPGIKNCPVIAGTAHTRARASKPRPVERRNLICTRNAIIGRNDDNIITSSSFPLCRTTNVAKLEVLLPPRLVCKGNAAATTTYVAKRDLPHLPHLSGGNRPVNASLNGDLDQDKSPPITRHVIARHAAPLPGHV